MYFDIKKLILENASLCLKFVQEHQAKAFSLLTIWLSKEKCIACFINKVPFSLKNHKSPCLMFMPVL